MPVIDSDHIGCPEVAALTGNQLRSPNPESLEKRVVPVAMFQDPLIAMTRRPFRSRRTNTHRHF